VCTETASLDIRSFEFLGKKKKDKNVTQRKIFAYAAEKKRKKFPNRLKTWKIGRKKIDR